MRDKHKIAEEPCDGKASSTVLESSGSRKGVADFNNLGVALRDRSGIKTRKDSGFLTHSILS